MPHKPSIEEEVLKDLEDILSDTEEPDELPDWWIPVVYNYFLYEASNLDIQELECLDFDDSVEIEL